MANTKAELTRHPLAIAWDEWLASKEGWKCADLFTAAQINSGPYLENRLHRAFDAGASTAESNLAKEVLAEIGKANITVREGSDDYEYQVIHNQGVAEVETRLGILFIRLNVKID